jgi:tetratricopeptide (TPR) repeat protein
MLLGSAGALVAMTLITLAVVRPPSAGSAPADPGARSWVIIADVENTTGEPVFQRSFPLALTVGLRQSSRLYVVSPERVTQALVRMRRPGADSALDEGLAREIARRDGIRYVVIPSVQRVGERFEISARVLDPQSATPLSLATVYASRPDQVLDAFDHVSRKLRRAMGESALGVATHSMPLPRVTTASLDALGKFAAGSIAFNNMRWNEARTLLTEAVALDSTFAAAHALLGLQAYYGNQPKAGEVHFAHALAHIDALPERERTLIRARIESSRENRAVAVDMRRAFLLQNPDDLEALHELAYDYLRLRLPHDARDVYRRVVALDSMSYNTWVNLAVVDKQLGQYDSALVRYRRALRLLPSMETENSNLNHEFGTTYMYVGQPDSAAAVFARMLGGDRNARARGLRSLAFLAMHRGRYEEASLHLREAVRLSRQTGATTSEIRNRLLLATSLQFQARAREIPEQLDSAYAMALRTDLDPLLGYWVGKALVRTGDVKRPQILLDAIEAARHPNSVTARAAVESLQGEILIARGETDRALPHLEQGLSADSTAISLESLAYGVLRAGNLERAAALYDQLTRSHVLGHEAQEIEPMASFTLAEIAARRGDSGLAISSYERFLETWSDPDRALPALIEARERLQRLRLADSSR